MNIQDSDLSAQELGALLLAATAPAVTSMAQDELAECLAEKYPDFAQLWIKSYELSNGMRQYTAWQCRRRPIPPTSFGS